MDHEIPVVGTVPKGLKKRQKELEIEQIETIETTDLLRLVKIPRRVLET